MILKDHSFLVKPSSVIMPSSFRVDSFLDHQQDDLLVAVSLTHFVLGFEAA